MVHPATYGILTRLGQNSLAQAANTTRRCALPHPPQLRGPLTLSLARTAIRAAGVARFMEVVYNMWAGLGPNVLVAKTTRRYALRVRRLHPPLLLPPRLLRPLLLQPLHLPPHPAEMAVKARFPAILTSSEPKVHATTSTVFPARTIVCLPTGPCT